MYEKHLICSIVYMIVMIQCLITMVVIYFKTKRTPTVYALLMVLLLLVLWLFFGIIEVQSGTTEEMLIAVRLTLFPTIFVGGAWLVFTLLYTEIITIKNKGIIIIILLPLIITYWPNLTQKYFYLSIIDKQIETHGNTVWGLFSNIGFPITYAYILGSVVILVIHSIKNYKYIKGRILLVIIAVLTIFSIHLLQFYKIIQDPGFNLVPVTFALFFMVLPLAIYRYNLFDVIQEATTDIFLNTKEAIIILDKFNRIVKYNKSLSREFETMIPINEQPSIINFLNRCSEHCVDKSNIEHAIKILQLNLETTFDTQFTIQSNNDIKEKRYYDLHYKKLFNKYNEETGAVITLRDKTKSIHELITNERNRISGDIHDHLSNMINVVSMNLEFAKDHYDEKEEALHCIDTAYQSANMVRMSLRRILEELEPMDIEKVGFLNALNTMFKKALNTGISIDFTSSGINDKMLSNSVYGYILYRTCMEGISNAFFSGAAQNITIVLTQTNKELKLLISDDGIGCEKLEKGRGLRNMERRIIDAGGSVSFDSIINEGFNISVKFIVDN